jgi:predicted  nucleic acid-binding Zn-ribbon protein
MVFSDQSFYGTLYKSSTMLQAINKFGCKFLRRVEEPVQPISREDLADQESQSDSDAESHKRNSSEAALEKAERKTAKKYIFNVATENNFLTHDFLFYSSCPKAS